MSVSPGANAPDPSHAAILRQWFDAVLALAKTGVSPGTWRDTGDTLLSVHGFNTDLKVMPDRHRRIHKGLEELGYGGAVVSFDWPCVDTAANFWRIGRMQGPLQSGW